MKHSFRAAFIIATALAVAVPFTTVKASLPNPDGEQVDLSDPSVRGLVPVPAGALTALNPGSPSGTNPGATTPAPSAVTAPVVIPPSGQRAQIAVQTSAGPVAVSFAGATRVGAAAPAISVTVVPSPTTGDATRGILAMSPRVRIVAPSIGFSSVEVCVPFDRSAVLASGRDIGRFRLLHFTNGTEKDITTRITLTGTRWQICGEATSFSEFQGSLLAGTRLAGTTRYGTAAAVANEVAPNGANRVLIASGEDYVDGLIAGLAAARSEAPLLLVRRDSVPAETLAALSRLRPTQIQIIGGTAAVNASVASTLATRTGARVTRIGGRDRFATAGEVMSAGFATGASTVLLVSGQSFADALGAGAVAAHEGAAMLLTSPTSLPSATADALRQLKPQRIIVVGGQAAVSDAVMQAARAFAPTSRIGGTDRYATSAILAARFTSATDLVAVTGRDFADGIVATSLAGRRGAPILLVNGDALTSPVNSRLRAIAPRSLFVLGGRAAVGSNAELALVRGLTPGTPQPV
jgi:putative cell wall-binding protein